MHVASSIKGEYYILLGIFVLSLVLKKGEGESDVNKSKQTHTHCVYMWKDSIEKRTEMLRT